MHESSGHLPPAPLSASLRPSVAHLVDSSSDSSMGTASPHAMGASAHVDIPPALSMEPPVIQPPPPFSGMTLLPVWPVQTPFTISGGNPTPNSAGSSTTVVPRATSLPNPPTLIGYFPSVTPPLATLPRRATSDQVPGKGQGNIGTWKKSPVMDSNIYSPSISSSVIMEDSSVSPTTQQRGLVSGMENAPYGTHRRPSSVSIAASSIASGVGQDPQRVLEDRRQRNARASARFRSRRKQREKELQERCAWLEERCRALEAMVFQYQQQLHALQQPLQPAGLTSPVQLQPADASGFGGVGAAAHALPGPPTFVPMLQPPFSNIME